MPVTLLVTNLVTIDIIGFEPHFDQFVTRKVAKANISLLHVFSVEGAKKIEKRLLPPPC